MHMAGGGCTGGGGMHVNPVHPPWVRPCSGATPRESTMMGYIQNTTAKIRGSPWIVLGPFLLLPFRPPQPPVRAARRGSSPQQRPQLLGPGSTYTGTVS
jgi:hypothetical protein